MEEIVRREEIEEEKIPGGGIDGVGAREDRRPKSLRSSMHSESKRKMLGSHTKGEEEERVSMEKAEAFGISVARSGWRKGPGSVFFFFFRSIFSLFFSLFFLSVSFLFPFSDFSSLFFISFVRSFSFFSRSFLRSFLGFPRPFFCVFLLNFFD